MKQILTILFVLCSILLNAQEATYSHADMVGTYRFDKRSSEQLHLLSDSTFVFFERISYKHYGKWEVKGNTVLLYFDKRELDALQGTTVIDRIEFKELRIIDRKKLAWPYARVLPWDTSVITHHESYLIRFKMKKKDKVRYFY